ncbi:MAG: 4-(cytidine 5'-diphospho)-2-C-methyl-D-erythritol kinase [Thermodesulfovibrionales bacterium]
MMLTIEAPAKINWFLRVLRRRNDGFHDIGSVIQKVSLADTLQLEEAESTEILCDTEISDNIVLRAIERLARLRKGGQGGMRVTLRKRIPLAAGLGGGSSDAASALVALNELWALGLSTDALVSIASEIGSDVPFFVAAKCALVTGRGEQVSPLRVTEAYDLLLVNPGIAVPSGWAYQHNRDIHVVDDMRGHAGPFVDALNRRDFACLREYMVNSLEGAVLKRYPVIADIKAELRRRGAMLSLMSGSGSTVYGVFEDDAMARRASSHFGEFWTSVVTTMA